MELISHLHGTGAKIKESESMPFSNCDNLCRTLTNQIIHSFVVIQLVDGLNFHSD